MAMMSEGSPGKFKTNRSVERNDDERKRRVGRGQSLVIVCVSVCVLVRWVGLPVHGIEFFLCIRTLRLPA